MLQNVQFVENEDGMISIPAVVSIKLIDFGVAEIFNASRSGFKCAKDSLTIDHQYEAPSVQHGGFYDARTADMWSFGLLMYQLLTGQALYQPYHMWFRNKNNPYWSLYNGQLTKYLKASDLESHFDETSYLLLCQLLNVRETERIKAAQCLKHNYFKSYFKKYQKKMNSKIVKYMTRLNDQTAKMRVFPYYQM